MDASRVPALWGPHSWYMIHSAGWHWASIKALPNDEDHVTKWFEGLPYVLPCGTCGAHCLAYIKANPPPIRGTSGTMELFWWTVDFHNAVNKRNGKRIYTREEAEAEFKQRVGPDAALSATEHDRARVADTKAFCARWSRARTGARILVGLGILFIIITAVLLSVRWAPSL